MKRSLGRLSLSIAALLGSSYAHAQDLTNYDAYFDANAAPSVAPENRINAVSPRGVVSSFDERRGVPSFFWAAKQQQLPPVGAAHTAEAAARWYLRENVRAWKLSPAAVDSAVVVRVHDTGRGGIVVTLRQQVDGLEVLHGELKVLMKRNLELVAISGSPRGAAATETKIGGRTFKITPEQAIANAFKNLYGVTLKTSSLRDAKKDKAGYKLFDLTSAPALQDDRLFIHPARVKKVFFPMPDRLVPAFFLEIFAGKIDEATSDGYAYVIAADDGRVLLRRNLTASESFDYRVWVESDLVPRDGPQADFTPHPTGVPDGSFPAFIAPVLVSMEGFNTNPGNVADPWLPAGAIETLGNNVDAYSDDDVDGFSAGDMRAPVTSPGVFDYTYDTAAEPQSSVTQTHASTTHLFYTNNWLHDWYYDSGFDESAGNAQADNFGRGGVGGDVLLAQAQDSAAFGQRNNANMLTPADGMSPRMQMYLWNGVNISQGLNVQPLNVDLLPGTASFGPRNFNYTAELTLGQDGVAPIGNACEAIVGDVVGKIVLVDRGVCFFNVKAQNAQQAGATGIIIVNNAANSPPLSPGGANPLVTIPVLGVTLEDGAVLKAALLNGPLTVTMSRESGVERDGTIDNNIVAHEWGHFLHHRLVQCGLQQCGGMSEGWGDFVALHMSVREGEDLDAAFAMAGYSTVTLGDSGYFGIRRAPYSTDFTKNGFTFRHIADGQDPPAHPLGSGGSTNAEVHNVGEIWSSMLFEGYVSLLKESQGPNPPYTFQEARRLMSDYIVAGMQLAPFEPTITQQRDAILAAAFANSPTDMVLLAEGFAKRGAGTCAVSPPIYSLDLVETVESFGVQGNLGVVAMDFDDSVASCDMDGLLDAEERGKVTITMMNTGIAPLFDTQGTLSSALPGVTFPNGPGFSFAVVLPYALATATVDIALDAAVQDIHLLDLKVDFANPVACDPVTSGSLVRRVNYDNAPAVAAFDTVESNILAWTGTPTPDGIQVWTRQQVAPNNHVWRGVDHFEASDTHLESPDLVVSNTEPLIFTMEHRYTFESGGGTNFDGGLIEISSDGGVTWEDIDTYADPGYPGVINEPTNALAGSAAFVGQSPSWPANDVLSLNLGAALAGQTIKIRFRIATDGGAGRIGWELDNIAFLGITNKPFPELTNDGSTCEGLPIANAGADQTVDGGNEVALDASGSSDPDGDALSFQWTQIAGPAVTLTDATATTPMFTAPVVAADTTLTFQVQVSDGAGATSDAVDILVNGGGVGGAGGGGGQGGQGGGDGGAGAQGGDNPGGAGPGPGPTSAGVGGGSTPDEGCGCSVVGNSGSESKSLAALLAAAALLIQRRRRASKLSLS